MGRSLDTFAMQPSGKQEYLQNYGYHFSKKAYEYAVSKMRKKDGSKVSQCTQEDIRKMMERYGLELKNNLGYDACYVKSMAMADYWGTSIEDEAHLARYIRDFLDDPDGGEEKAFRHWYADMLEEGTPIMWDDIM